MILKIDLCVIILFVCISILFILIAYVMGENKNTIDYIKVMNFDKLKNENEELKEALRLNKKYKGIDEVLRKRGYYDD